MRVWGCETVIPIKWSDAYTIDKIYDDPTDLFVKLEDKDNTGYFERCTTGPGKITWIPRDDARRI